MKIEMEPLSLAETKKIVETIDEKKEESKEIKAFLKKFANLNEEDAAKLRKELENLNIIKLKKEHIVKLIDLLPEDASDINKIFIDISLEENEINKLLEVIKKHS